jgi:hypothetical protein
MPTFSMLNGNSLFTVPPDKSPSDLLSNTQLRNSEGGKMRTTITSTLVSLLAVPMLFAQTGTSPSGQSGSPGNSQSQPSNPNSSDQTRSRRSTNPNSTGTDMSGTGSSSDSNGTTTSGKHKKNKKSKKDTNDTTNPSGTSGSSNPNK